LGPKHITSLISRSYSREDDLRLMIDLLIAVRSPEHIADYPGITDLHEAMQSAEIQENTRPWSDSAGRLLGFAFVDPWHNLCFESLPLAMSAGSKQGSEMMAWAIDGTTRATHKSGEPVTLKASCRDDDTQRIALLERHGFFMKSMRTLVLSRSLHEPIPNPHLSAGFIIRPVAGEQEAEPLAALHRAAFGTNYLTVEKRLAWMRTPEYDPQLDLVVIAPDGRHAAYCLCSISVEENAHSGRQAGYTDPLTTHPDFQRRGLARALLLTGLHLLKTRGMETARFEHK
jgi:GNAT superfamily N-acetyltransferase